LVLTCLAHTELGVPTLEICAKRMRRAMFRCPRHALLLAAASVGFVLGASREGVIHKLMEGQPSPLIDRLAAIKQRVGRRERIVSELDHGSIAPDPKPQNEGTALVEEVRMISSGQSSAWKRGGGGGGYAARCMQLSEWGLYDGKEPSGCVPKGLNPVPPFVAPEAQLASAVLDCPDAPPTCPEFAGFPSQQLDGALFDVVVSIAMFEPPWYLRQTLQNALAFTSNSTLLVLHLDKHTQYPGFGVNSDFDWLWVQPRLVVSCYRTATARWHGSVLLAHMINAELAWCLGVNAQYVVQQASNMWWAETGMESYVRKHKSSSPRLFLPPSGVRIGRYHPLFNAHEECEEIMFKGRTQQGQGSMACMRLALGLGKHPDPKGNASVVWPDACKVPPIKGISFLVQGKHEGSFYPASEIHAFAQYMRPMLMNKSLEQEWKLATQSQAHCKKSGTSTHWGSEQIYETHWPMEEIMLQSWMASFSKDNGTGHILCAGQNEHYANWGGGGLPVPEKGVPSCPSNKEVFAVKYKDIRNETAQWLREQINGCLGQQAKGNE
jgi:hypothetical protein